VQNEAEKAVSEELPELCRDIRSITPEALTENDQDHIDEELGDLLFAVVNLIRFRGGKSASELLRQANLKFENRFRKMEKCFADAGKVLDGADPETFDRFWEMVKKSEVKHEK